MSITPGRLAAGVLRWVPRTQLSRAVGAIATVKGPEPVVRACVNAFVKAYDIDLSDTVAPSRGYESFDAFFTRRLKDGARPVDPRPDALVSPADGRVEDLGVVRNDGGVRVKGQTYTVHELLGDADDADAFVGGHYFVVYLSPRDYHRVHAPSAGEVEHSRYVPGTLYPVNDIGTRYVPKLFARNERVVTMQRSAHHGRVATIMVGAIGVGRIELCFDDTMTNVGQRPGTRRYPKGEVKLDRADELGIFHLGSTAVVLCEPWADIEVAVNANDKVKVGQALAYGGAG